jgi:hypothetical protein
LPSPFFSISPKGDWIFLYGSDAPEKAAACARNCPVFSRDHEDECIADEEVSCYNCKWRRWNMKGFTCLAPFDPL